MAEPEQDVQLLLERKVEPLAAIVDFNRRQTAGRATGDPAEVDSAEPAAPDHRCKVLREGFYVPPAVPLHRLRTRVAATAGAALTVVLPHIASGRSSADGGEL